MYYLLYYGLGSLNWHDLVAIEDDDEKVSDGIDDDGEEHDENNNVHLVQCDVHMDLLGWMLPL